jgi:hypothetical protein
MAEASDKGSDPNDEQLRKFGDPSKSEDHKSFDPTQIPKEPDAVPFKITTSGNK